MVEKRGNKPRTSVDPVDCEKYTQHLELFDSLNCHCQFLLFFLAILGYRKARLVIKKYDGTEKPSQCAGVLFHLSR